MPIRGVAFDLDYTLTVPTRDRETLLSEAVAAVGAPAISREEYLATHRAHLTDESREPIFSDLLGRRETEADPGALATAYREAVTGALVPVEGVERLLESLREQYRVGLLTNGPARAQRAKLERLGWTDSFDAALVTGELPAGKPDGAAFEALVDALGTEPAETVYVGDDVRDDVGGAADAGLLPVQVLSAEGPPVDPRAVAAVDRGSLSRDLPDLLAALDA